MYTLNEISDPAFVNTYMQANQDPKGTITVELGDGVFTMPVRIGMINLILWQVFFARGKVPYTKDFYDLNHINDTTFSKIHTKIYSEFVEELKQEVIGMTPKAKTKHEEAQMDIILEAFWVSINDIYRFIHRWCGEYHQSLSILSLSKLYHQPEIQKLNEVYLNPDYGPIVCETQLNNISDQLIELLGSGTLEYNPLVEFMETGSLKTNQIPQMLLAYGPRSDIDDTMMKHVINASAISGLQNIQDYVTESLGAKKAGYSNKVVIKSSQYFYRRLRLVCASQVKLYKGDCGSTITIPYLLHEKSKMNLLDKQIVVDGKPVILTKENIDQFVNTEIQLKSPLGCKHRDGVCEACCGRGDIDTSFYTNLNQHIGINAASKVGSSVSQMVLSAKHLIRTHTKVYTIPNEGKHFLTIANNQLYWKEGIWNKIKNARLNIPVSALGPLEDLSNPKCLPVHETYSAINEFELVTPEGKVITKISLTDGTFVPFFSKATLRYLARQLPNITCIDNVVSIPLNEFDRRKAFFKFILVNDDMIAFTESIDKFLKGTIGGYTVIAQALRDFTSILYSKTSVNMYYIEVMLKAFMITSKTDFRMPTVTDQNNVLFGTISTILTGRDLSTKLGFERLGEYFREVSTYTSPRTKGLFDRYFGL